MRKDITVGVEKRDSRGKNEARRLRAKGMSPAVVYGPGVDPVAVSVNPKEIHQILRSASGHNTIFNLDMSGDRAPVMVVDWQLDPIKGHLLHIDLKRIDLTKRIIVKVPVHTKGDPAGVKQQSGLHEVVTREIEIECLPDDIPEHFEVDVSHLMIGQNVRASDIQLGEAVKLKSPADAVISHVVSQRAEEAPAAEEVAIATAPEPEVIKKGKKEEEGAAPAPAADKKPKK